MRIPYVDPLALAGGLRAALDTAEKSYSGLADQPLVNIAVAERSVREVLRHNPNHDSRYFAAVVLDTSRTKGGFLGMAKTLETPLPVSSAATLGMILLETAINEWGARGMKPVMYDDAQRIYRALGSFTAPATAVAS